MTLAAGTRIGSYEVVGPLGAGGMGQVYRARDTRLDRSVALKILPPAFAGDPDRLMRFEREAKTLAALNHQHIAQVYGLEDLPPTDAARASRALVMELVDGEDLSARIARAPMPIDEALAIARQIAEALEAAHEAGIIHRDLKPANVKLRPDGTVKVLDFGLAKGSIATQGSERSADDRPYNSPTITSTEPGIILGTAAYMAPEQARGRPVDRRADIWAFGCVLFEMLTARRAVKGDDITETLANVLKSEPEWTALAEAPLAIRRLVRRCLEKDPKDRLRSIGDAILDIDDALRDPEGQPIAPTAGPKPVARFSPWLAAASLALVGLAFAAGVVAAGWFRTAPVARIARFGLALPPNSLAGQIAITPDGSRVVFVGSGGRLMVRALDSLEPVEIARGALPTSPFVSPDGQWVGYVDEAVRLMKVPTAGGTPTRLALVEGRITGATWVTSDTIVISSAAATGLLRVAAAGGTPVPITTPEGGFDHIRPLRLPDGRAVLFTVAPQGLAPQEGLQLAVLDLDTGQSRILLQGGGLARVVSSGYLAYLARGTIFAVPFDVRSRTVPGSATPIDTGVRASAFDVSIDGTLIYIGPDAGAELGLGTRTLAWVDRSGKETDMAAAPRAYQYPQISPDGTRIAVTALDDGADIWMLDTKTTAISRLTFDPGGDTSPVWTPDGKRIVFASSRASGVFNLWWQAADGTGEAERLTNSPVPQFATSVTPDGNHAIFWVSTGEGKGRDLAMVALDGSRRVTPLLQTPDDELFAAVSPNGRWLAYESSSSGRRNVYVRPFPRVEGGQWQITTDEGRQPSWSRDGKELFFLDSTGAFMRVRVIEESNAFRAGPFETVLSGTRYYGSQVAALVARTYDLSPDGVRFVMLKSTRSATPATSTDLMIVQHWSDSLNRRDNVR